MVQEKNPNLSDNVKTTVRTVGYVKLAKLWERQRKKAIVLHTAYFEEYCNYHTEWELEDVFIDITGSKNIYKRQEMVKLLKACSSGKVDLIITPTRAYLAPNSAEFCYLIRFLMELPYRIDIVTDDDEMRIDTIQNVADQRENLYSMAMKYTQLIQSDYEYWRKKLIDAMNDLQKGGTQI